jgi:hypothetical protein
VLSRRTQAKLLLKLKRTHRSKGTKMVMQLDRLMPATVMNEEQMKVVDQTA